MKSHYSIKYWLWGFVAITSLVALLFWIYLNVQASLQVKAQQANIQLSHSLPTIIHVGNYLQAHARGTLDTKIDLKRQLDLPLKGKYLADLAFTVEVPIQVDLDYQTQLKIRQNMPLETTTDLIYQNKLLPKFPLKLDIPIHLDVPFHLKRQYQLPVKIMFHGPVYFDFNESVHLYVDHQFTPKLNLNDPITLQNIAAFHATMYNTERNTKANLNMQMNLPLKNIHP
ncbi:MULTISPECIES: hypothetical protein [Acinetobacter]|uniref:DUF2140 family protein n=1 Tax=Acinetobacter chengduensis TaxID=2420890 RepID=A0ABX9TX49_9GAMM|nr:MULTISPECIES: hypothetical protein [Acinetobacter]MBI1450639.1 hypothetical protein [Acinetobacter sp. FL51]RKG40728.1 hypothetical protein D7V31_11575 [Acinetobacter sp. WCHAc060007]RLL22129.1 hypothetical protein D9K81_08240 [Acinetobacter chengduensis]